MHCTVSERSETCMYEVSQLLDTLVIHTYSPVHMLLSCINLLVANRSQVLDDRFLVPTFLMALGVRNIRRLEKRGHP